MARGYSQILWVFGEDDEVTEVGAMNVFFLLEREGGDGTKRELVTPPLERGDILPGVTRQSILELSREWGEFDVVERSITMPEIRVSIETKCSLRKFWLLLPLQCFPSGTNSNLHVSQINSFHRMQQQKGG